MNWSVVEETHYWRWDAGYNVVAEYKDQSPDWNVGALQRFFVPFGHTALAEATSGAGGSVSTGAYTYLAHDHLGTTRKGYNQAKTEVHSNEHLPFGQRFSTTGTVPYHEWTGKPWDAESQMYYFPYRYYSPMMNRWTAADPLGLVDGPNVYGYVGGNPIMHFDPEGGAATAIFFAGLATYAVGTPFLALMIAWVNRVCYDGFDGKGGFTAVNKNQNDHYKHCVTSCRMARYSLNPWAAKGVGIAGELLDIGGVIKYAPKNLIGGMVESYWDMVSNNDRLACKWNFTKSCSRCCKEKGYDPALPCESPHPKSSNGSCP